MNETCPFCLGGFCILHGSPIPQVPTIPIYPAPAPAPFLGGWSGTITFTGVRTADQVIARLAEIRAERSALLKELAALVEKASEA